MQIVGYINTNKEQWVKQEEEGRTSSGRTHHRSKEYEDGGDEQKAEENGGDFRGRQVPRRGCSAIDG